MNADEPITLPAPAQRVSIGRLRSRRERALRPRGLRVAHALGLETTAVLVTGNR